MMVIDFLFGAMVGVLTTLSVIRFVDGMPAAKARLQASDAMKAIRIEGNTFRCLMPNCPRPGVPHIHASQFAAMQDRTSRGAANIYPPVWADPPITRAPTP